MKTLRGAALLAWLALAGCNQILGIEVQDKSEGDPRDADKDAGSDAGKDGGDDIEYESPSEADCTKYCDELKTSCNPMSEHAAFANDMYCRGLCPRMQSRPDKMAVGNTFECRLKKADEARQAGTSDNGTECKAAGAGGNAGPGTMNNCSTNCEGYCQLFAAVCSEYPDLLRGETCVSECEKLVVDNDSNAAAAFMSASDTLQCRLAHLGAASVSADLAATHCPHAAISIATAYTPCLTPVPKCEDYCGLIMNVCTGDIQQYDNEADCVATCKGGLVLNETPLRSDEPTDQTRDTVACRRYHAHNALKLGGLHCEHAGPSGDGHCGSICPSYCRLAKAACGMQYGAKYPAEKDCLDDCAGVLKEFDPKQWLDDHYRVSTGKKGGNTMSCRFYNATKAFGAGTGGASRFCPSVLGLAGSDCTE